VENLFSYCSSDAWCWWWDSNLVAPSSIRAPLCLILEKMVIYQMKKAGVCGIVFLFCIVDGI